MDGKAVETKMLQIYVSECSKDEDGASGRRRPRWHMIVFAHSDNRLGLKV